MPLSPAAEREAIHTRSIEARGYKRTDGLWDIEGHLTDVAGYTFHNEWRGEIRPGEPIHDMWIRLTVDHQLTIVDIEARTDAGPYPECPAINAAFAKLKQTRVGPGWRRVVRDRLGGIQGCTHLVDLLGPVATVAYHTVHWARPSSDGKPARLKNPPINTCHVWSAGGEMVRTQWPEHFVAPAAPREG